MDNELAEVISFVRAIPLFDLLPEALVDKLIMDI